MSNQTVKNAALVDSWGRTQLSGGTRLKRTPHEEVGPSYPVVKPPDRGWDLTLNPATGKRAQGTILYLSGRVLDTEGQPISGAKVEIWQANTYGRYTHPHDPNPAPLDPEFEGYGIKITAEDGRYSFRTIKPGPYPTSASPGWWRPSHIHFEVTTATDRFTTQMYFEGEPLNESDELLARHRRLGAADRVMSRRVPLSEGQEPNAMAVTFDIVLPSPLRRTARRE